MIFKRLKLPQGLLFIILALTSLVGVCQPRILILGDSLSAAYQIPIEKSWVSMLTKKVQSSFPQGIIINSSIVGNTTAGGLTQLPNLIKHHQPNVIIIELGGNDGLLGLPIYNIKSNLAQLITMSLNAKAKVLLIGVKLPPNYGQNYLNDFISIFGQLSKEYNVPYLFFHSEKVIQDPTLLLSDKIHPSIKAQPLLLELIWPSLYPLLS